MVPVAARPNGLSADDAPALALDEPVPPPVAHDDNGTSAAAARDPVSRVRRANDVFSMDTPQFAPAPAEQQRAPGVDRVMPSPVRPVEVRPHAPESIPVRATGKEPASVVTEKMQVLITTHAGELGDPLRDLGY